MITPTATPHVAVRVSPLRSVVERAGVGPERAGAVEIAGSGRDAEALADLGTCDRIGFKGREAGRWLASNGIALPDRPNRVLERADGLIVARLADAEFLLADFGAAVSPSIDALRDAYARGPVEGCHDVPRAESQAALGLVGRAAGAALPALCPADLRPAAFAPGDVLQTTCAGVSAQLWNLSTQATGRWVLLCDASVSQHVWEALHPVVLAEGGRVGPQAAWFARPPSNGR